jgi:hypothetical protein
MKGIVNLYVSGLMKHVYVGPYTATCQHYHRIYRVLYQVEAGGAEGGWDVDDETIEADETVGAVHGLFEDLDEVVEPDEVPADERERAENHECAFNRAGR